MDVGCRSILRNCCCFFCTLINLFIGRFGKYTWKGMLKFQIESSEEGEVTLGDYEVVSIESQTEIDRKKSGLSLSLSPSRIPPQNIQTPNGPEDESGKYACYTFMNVIM